MTESATISSRFKSERKRLGFSQDELASAIGTSRSTVAYYESGRSVPDLVTMERARQVGMDTWFIQTGEKAGAGISEADWRKLFLIAQSVEKWMKANEIPRSAHAELELVRLLYEKGAQEGFLNSQSPAELAKQAA